MYFIYNVLLTLGLLVSAPYFLLQGLRRGKNVRNIPERLALRFPKELKLKQPDSPGAIWLHAVSVGEALAVVPLARALKARYPQRRLVISTTTETGQALAHERLKFADAIFYFPLDLRGAMRRAFRVVQPGIIIIMETEIWPNFLRTARERRVSVVYANGRISDRSYRGFKRWVRPDFRQRVFAEGRMYLMQSDQDAQRIIELGAPADRVNVAGNIKYDLPSPCEIPLVTWLKRELEIGERAPVIVAGSILSGEEEPVLKAFAAVTEKHPRALLIMAPRKPERFSESAAVIQGSGFDVLRRTEITSLNGMFAGILRQRSVVLLDTLGELASVYQLADATFIGGSLIPAGGHNPLEPAVFGKVPVFGPSMENFRQISDQFLRAGAAVQVTQEKDLSAAWLKILGDSSATVRMGQKARELVDVNRGATAESVRQLSELIDKEELASR